MFWMDWILLFSILFSYKKSTHAYMFRLNEQQFINFNMMNTNFLSLCIFFFNRPNQFAYGIVFNLFVFNWTFNWTLFLGKSSIIFSIPFFYRCSNNSFSSCRKTLYHPIEMELSTKYYTIMECGENQHWKQIRIVTVNYRC